MKIKAFNSFLFLIFPLISFAQEVLITTGGNVEATGSIFYSVGQVFYITSEDSTGSTLQGV